jgi:hypothetical protein
MANCTFQSTDGKCFSDLVTRDLFNMNIGRKARDHIKREGVK